MKNTERNDVINLIGNFKVHKKKPDKSFKGEYTRFFPTKMSSSNFLTLFSLFVLKGRGEPVYGKEILTEIQSMLDESVWKPSHGTLYPLLSDLENKGYIRVVSETKSRKFYEITEAGKEYLDEQLDTFKSVLVSSSQFFDKVINKMYKNLERGE